MKFGSKGLDAPVIIGIILAVVAAVIILYILWSRGMLPFVSSVNEADCTAYFYRSCQSSNQNFGDNIKNILCKSFAEKLDKSGADTCFAGPGGGGGTTPCADFCNSVLAT